jgi:(p)ppGpp synthase/HD superfamily hydrolase
MNMSIERASALVSCRPAKRFWGASHPALRQIHLPPPQGKFSAREVEFATQVFWHRLQGLLDEVVTGLKELNPGADSGKVMRAFSFAAFLHAGEYRKSGLPFIMHPLEAAKIAVEMKCGDADVICALLLHDTLENTPCKVEDINRNFGFNIAKIVEGLSRYRKGIGKLKEERESLEKTIEFSQEDLGVIFAKLCDRLHNMRTLESMEPNKQIEIAEETINIYAPLANRLGFRALYRELQNRSLMYLRPEDFRRVKGELAALEKDTLAKREEIARTLMDELGRETSNEDGTINAPLAPGSCQVVFTPRLPFEIFEQEEKRKVLEVRPSDVFSFLVLVKNVADTDKVIGRIHRLPGFAYVEHTYVDLIGHPSPNGYEAKHTAVMSAVGVVRIQTTTFVKHQKNEYGQAIESRTNPAGWFEDRGSVLKDWLKHLKSREVPFGKIRRALKAAGKEIAVFAVRPGLRVDEQPEEISLSYGATALDLAYAVHEEIGLRAVRCMINGRPVPLHEILENGDRVSIYIEEGKIPNIDELEWVHTISAAEKLIRFLETSTVQTSKMWLPAGKLRQALKPWFLDPYDFEDEKVENLTRIWLAAVERRYKGLRKESAPKEGEAEEGVLVRLLRWISLEDLTASDAVAAFRDIFNRNRARMQSTNRGEQERIYRFKISADRLPEVPGVLAVITSAIADLGFNIKKSTLKGESLSLEVEITWPLHEIQIERIILEKAPGSHIVKKSAARKTKKVRT